MQTTIIGGEQVFQIAGELRESNEKNKKFKEEQNALREMMKILNATNNGLRIKLEELCDVGARADDERINYQLQIGQYQYRYERDQEEIARQNSQLQEKDERIARLEEALRQALKNAK